MRRLERRGAVVGGPRFYGIQPVGNLRPWANHHHRSRCDAKQLDNASPVAFIQPRIIRWKSPTEIILMVPNKFDRTELVKARGPR
jgi:hypothetical protein